MAEVNLEATLYDDPTWRITLQEAGFVVIENDGQIPEDLDWLEEASTGDWLVLGDDTIPFAEYAKWNQTRHAEVVSKMKARVMHVTTKDVDYSGVRYDDFDVVVVPDLAAALAVLVPPPITDEDVQAAINSIREALK